METLLALPLIFFVAFIPRFLAARKIDMTWDEGLYVLNGVTAVKNVKELNFSPSAWGLEFHPPVVMYFYGVTYTIYVLVATMLKRGLNFDLNSLYERGISLFNGRRTLLVVRLPSIMFGSLSCVLVYLLCLDVFKSEAIGIMAALFLALTPSFIAWSSLAMLESGVTFFYLLTIWTLLRALDYGSLSYTLASGVSLGLTFGGKETGFGLPLVTLPWLALSLFKTYLTEGVGTIFGSVQLLVLWLLLGFSVFFVTWPLLWRNPVKQFMKNLRSVSNMASGGGCSYYAVSLLSSSSVFLVVFFAAGTLIALQLGIGQTSSVLFLSWAFVPLILMSTPFIPKRGEYEVAFVLPSFSILAGLAVENISKTLVNTFDLGFYGEFMPLLISSAIVSLMLFECASVHPYYMNHRNFIGKLTGKLQKGFSVGCWGEGMSEAMAYVDQNAPADSLVWVYGPKSSAIYHSLRVDFAKTFDGESLLHERAKAGFDVPVDARFYNVRKGDLKFCFPYYHHGKHDGLDFAQLKAEDVSYIVIYRWATYDPAITLIDSGNNKIISALRNDFMPVFTVKIKDTEVCWVYRVKDLGD